ncbi:hypothetical protein QFZ56_001264 [Streptomyces achromogenes]|uniref:Uncharacterized protein n=1 Tax=Streptomyces achromogenes TaxID=67255 RepID=A0ABU0PWG3_STRAH|nr:hypothetical protein [Streptomyces achromogenes]
MFPPVRQAVNGRFPRSPLVNVKSSRGHGGRVALSGPNPACRRPVRGGVTEITTRGTYGMHGVKRLYAEKQMHA